MKVFPPTMVADGGTGEPGALLEADQEGITVACGEGALRLRELQPDGGKRVPAGEFLTGHPVKAGDLFFSLENGGKKGHA